MQVNKNIQFDYKHRIGNKGNSAVQHVPLYLCSLLARIMAEQPVQRFCWPEKAIDWPEHA